MWWRLERIYESRLIGWLAVFVMGEWVVVLVMGGWLVVLVMGGWWWMGERKLMGGIW